MFKTLSLLLTELQRGHRITTKTRLEQYYGDGSQRDRGLMRSIKDALFKLVQLGWLKLVNDDEDEYFIRFSYSELQELIQHLAKEEKQLEFYNEPVLNWGDIEQVPFSEGNHNDEEVHEIEEDELMDDEDEEEFDFEEELKKLFEARKNDEDDKSIKIDPEVMPHRSHAVMTDREGNVPIREHRKDSDNADQIDFEKDLNEIFERAEKRPMQYVYVLKKTRELSIDETLEIATLVKATPGFVATALDVKTNHIYATSDYSDALEKAFRLTELGLTSIVLENSYFNLEYTTDESFENVCVKVIKAITIMCKNKSSAVETAKIMLEVVKSYGKNTKAIKVLQRVVFEFRTASSKIYNELRRQIMS